MSDTANETLTTEEFRQKYGGDSQLSLDGLGAPADEYDQALAIDPGSDTGLAWTDGETVKTVTTDFWGVYDQLSGTPPRMGDPEITCVILEAPYKSRPGMWADETAIAYRSGQVAREAELMQEAADEWGYTVIEHDPSQQGRKWDDDFARKIVGDWEGPSNEHCRDAIRLLFFYDFL